MKFLILLCAFVATSVCAADPNADANAKYLAGMSVRGTPLDEYGQDAKWAAHSAEFDRAWARLELRQLAKIREWSPQFLGEPYADEGPMFYMFSGPDFLYAHAFFPNASSYILCGIEPVGEIPDIENIPAATLPSALANLRKTLESVLDWSFFITKKMKVDLKQKQLNGTLPVLYIFLARAGCTIDSVELVALDREGNFVPAGKGTTPGVKIAFTGSAGRAQTLYYFASDLSDWGIKSSPGFMKFCSRQGDGVSLLKAASYLMHGNNFTQVRDFLLGHSKVILQDDSGIPQRFFAEDKWRVRYCGHYSGPIPMFKKYPQPELAKMFTARTPAPLGFGFGYQWHPNRSSLIVATPKTAAALPADE